LQHTGFFCYFRKTAIVIPRQIGTGSFQVFADVNSSFFSDILKFHVAFGEVKTVIDFIARKANVRQAIIVDVTNLNSCSIIMIVE